MHTSHSQAEGRAFKSRHPLSDVGVDSSDWLAWREPRRSTSVSTSWTWDGIPSALLAAAVVILLALGWSAIRPTEADAAVYSYGTASSYGPGLYGNRTACGQTLYRSTLGVAHRTLPCGTKLQICHRGVCRYARVIDRGPYSGSRVLDLTAATTYRLCACSPWAWGVRTVKWRRM